MATKKRKEPRVMKLPSHKEYTFEIFLRKRVKKKLRFVRIPIEEFRPGRYYRIYVKHKPTKQRRFLGFGKFMAPPFFSPEHRSVRYDPRTKRLVPTEVPIRRYGGRRFLPLPMAKKVVKGWIPVSRIVKDVESEVNQLAKDFDTSVWGVILPVKRYFHPTYMVFSDKIMKPEEKLKGVFVNCVTRLVYPRKDWIGKQGILIDLQGRNVMVKNIHKYTSRWENEANQMFEMTHPEADIAEVIKINGYIPVDYIPKPIQVLE